MHGCLSKGYGRQAQIVGVIFFREPVRAQIAVLFNQRGGTFAITDYKGIGFGAVTAVGFQWHKVAHKHDLQGHRFVSAAGR